MVGIHGGGSESWQDFLTRYQTGDFPACDPPDQPISLEFGEHADVSLPIYSAVQVGKEDALKAAAYYDMTQTLAPPRSSSEAARIRLIEEYVLKGPQQMQAMNKAADLAHDFFESIVTISLFDEQHQIVHCVRGDFDLEPGSRLDIEKGICSHAVLRRDRQPLQVVDTRKDWRFKSNPWCGTSTGIGSYFGMPVCLSEQIMDSDKLEFGDKTIPIGTIALFTIGKIREPLSPKELRILRRLADGLSRDLTTNRLSQRRAKEAQLRECCQHYLNDTLNDPKRSLTDETNGKSSLQLAPAAQTLSQLRCLLNATVAFVLDITIIHRNKDNKFDFIRQNTANTSLTTLLVDKADEYEFNFSKLIGEDAAGVVVQFLDCHAKDGQKVYTTVDSTSSSPLSTFFEPSLTAHIAVPLFSNNQPHLLVVLAANASRAHFIPSDAQFLTSFGTITQGYLARKQLIAMDEAKTRWLAQVTHELRTPLYGLTAEVDCVAAALEAGNLDEARTYLESAKECGESLSEVLNDVLDYGKLRTADDGRPKTPTNGARNEAERDVLHLIEMTAKHCIGRFKSEQANDELLRRSVELWLSFEERPEADWLLNIDVTGVRRAVFNLITNAFKYTDSGRIDLSLRLTHDPTSILFSVSDTGRGMDDAVKSRLFQPFMQADALAPGAGLGLYITQALVVRMNGSITVTSQVDQGSCFTISIPVSYAEGRSHQPSRDKSSMHCRLLHSAKSSKLADTPDFKVPASPRAKLTPERSSAVKKLHPDLRVLVVDDNRIGRQILVRLLQKYNVDFREAKDGQAAVQAFSEFYPHVVWTDINMPKLDGVSAAAQMRQSEKQAGLHPALIIALTALGSSDDLTRREALLGMAALDDWHVKGQSKLSNLENWLFIASDRLYKQQPSS